jgi:protein-disulfide isomerase
MEHKDSLNNAMYVLSAALLISVLMVSASIYFSVGGLTSVLEGKNFQVTLPQAQASGSEQGAQAGPHVKGPAGAKVTITEYSDFQCSFCARAEPILTAVMGQYPSQVKLVYKHYPLPATMHPDAQKAAEASECAADQGKFWEMHDWMFANQGSLGVSGLKAAAKSLGMNSATFDSCLDSGSKAAIVSADQQEGAALGVGGTPTFYINGQQVVGADPDGINAAVASAISG